MTTFGPPQTDADHWPPLGVEAPPPPTPRLGWSLVVVLPSLASVGLFHRYSDGSGWITLLILAIALVLTGPMAASDVSSWRWALRMRDAHQHWRTEPYKTNELGNLAVRCPCGALIVREDLSSGTKYLTIENDGQTGHRFTTTRQRPAREGGS